MLRMASPDEAEPMTVVSFLSSRVEGEKNCVRAIIRARGPRFKRC
jgi:hypothetical protein